MATVDHSQAHVDLAGGAENMFEKMKSAYSDGNLQWVLELAEHLIQTNNCVSLAKVRKFIEVCCCLKLLAYETVFYVHSYVANIF